MTSDERNLVRRAQTGDEAAFETLVRRYERRVLGLAMRFTGNFDAADDIYQEVFLRVFNALPRFRFQSEFSTWIYKVTANACLTHRAVSSRRQIVSLEKEIEPANPVSGGAPSLPEALVSEANSEKEALRQETAGRIRQALVTLSPQQRLVFALRHFEGHKLREIAVILGCAEGTVKKHLFSAIQRLREELRGVYS